MKKTYTMIDENNNIFTTTYKTARRFFKLHGGNSVLIVDPDGATKHYTRRADGKIIEK